MSARDTIWHAPDDEPTQDKFLLGVDASGYAIYRWCGQYDSWTALCREERLKRWCYIDDVELM